MIKIKTKLAIEKSLRIQYVIINWVTYSCIDALSREFLNFKHEKLKEKFIVIFE